VGPGGIDRGPGGGGIAKEGAIAIAKVEGGTC